MAKSRLNKQQFSKIARITINGQKWFDKVNGNTYNSVQFTIELKDFREFDFTLMRTYGYGDYYVQRVTEWLETVAPKSLLGKRGCAGYSDFRQHVRDNIKLVENCQHGLKREMAKEDDLSALVELLKI